MINVPYDVGLFSYISDFKDLDKYAKVRHYKKGEVIFREDDQEDDLYVLLDGVVVSYRTSLNGQERILCFFKPSDIYGNITMADDHVHSMTAQAIEPVVNLEINKGYIKKLIRQNSDLLWFLYKDLANKLRNSNSIIETAFLTAEQRIAIGLTQLSQQFGYQTNRGLEIRIDIIQEDLARYTGTTRVTVAKVISSWVDKGILSTRPKPWVIHKMDSLLRMVPDTVHDKV